MLIRCWILVAKSQPKTQRLINVGSATDVISTSFQFCPPAWIQRSHYRRQFQRLFNRRDINLDITSNKRRCFGNLKNKVISIPRYFTSTNRRLFNVELATLFHRRIIKVYTTLDKYSVEEYLLKIAWGINYNILFTNWTEVVSYQQQPPFYVNAEMMQCLPFIILNQIMF